MQHLEVSGAVRPLKWSLGVKWLMYSFRYNKQDATLYNILYYCQCCTSFRRFLRQSSGVQKLYTQHRVYVKLACSYRLRASARQLSTNL